MNDHYIIGSHVLWAEYKCRHCGKLPPGFYKDDEISIEFSFFFGIFENLRTKFGGPLAWSSGYRCTDHQLNLFKAGKSETPYSVHVFGLAGDLKCKDKAMAEKVVAILRGIDARPRVGWKNYINKPTPWVHFDVGFLIEPAFSDKLKRGKEW